MDSSRIVLLINDDCRAITARYEDGGKAETFKTMDPTIMTDDLVVVVSGTRHGMTVAKVVEVDVDVNFDTIEPVKWVVQRIDKIAFDALLEREKEGVDAVNAAERRRKKAELRKNMMADHEAMIGALSITKIEDADATE